MKKFMVAEGHDNADLLQQLHTYAPPLFENYPGSKIPQTFKETEGRIQNGARRWVSVGTASATIFFVRLVLAEFDYLKSTFCADGLDGLVTVRLFNSVVNSWKTYNATMVLPPDMKGLAGFDDVEIAFQDLEEI